jgi:two-component system sensor histidine kinase HydH
LIGVNSVSGTGSHESPDGLPAARKVRLWHFVVLPTLAMGLVIIVSRLLEAYVIADLGSAATDAFNIARTVLISLLMTSLIGWLAISYRRQYEAELEERNKTLEATRDFLSRIIEGSGEAIVTLDADERVTSWNRAAEVIYGWSSDEMLGQPFDRIVPAEPEAQSERERVHELIRSGETLRDYQATRLHKDGSRVTVRITRSPLYDRSARYVGSTGIVRDVTEVSKMETRLREQERLAAVGELAAQVAHEVRNPLAGIRGACELLMSGNQRLERNQEIAAEVVQQIDRLNRTVGDLLLFARPTDVRPRPTDLHELIDRVAAVLAEDPQAQGVKLERHYTSKLPAVSVDPQQLEQVFFNVLLNASQAMEHSGMIDIRTEMNLESVQVTIRDSGPGIPEKAAADIFKPFYTTRAQGTGLGLAIVNKIVQAHQGTIDAGRSPEGGAEFRIRLPLTQDLPSEPAEATKS